jgi:hypothetical protein
MTTQGMALRMGTRTGGAGVRGVELLTLKVNESTKRGGLLVFIADPTGVFKAYIRSSGRVDDLQFNLGRMSMALEIITQIKALEELKAVVSDLGRAEAITALDTLLQDCGLREVAYEMYEKLNEWRHPKFLPVVSNERVPPGIAVVVGPDDRRPLATIRGLSLQHVSPPSVISPGERPRALPPGRHGLAQDADPSSELGGQSSPEE